MQVYGDVVWLSTHILKVCVVKKLNPSLYNKENLRTLVTLSVEYIFRVDFNLRKQREHCPDKLLTFLIKKANLAYDFTVSVRNNL